MSWNFTALPNLGEWDSPVEISSTKSKTPTLAQVLKKWYSQPYLSFLFDRQTYGS